MRGTVWLRTAVLAMLVTATAGAQSGVAGVWNTEIARGMRNENGVVTMEDRVPFRLELILDGDQVTGTWAPKQANGIKRSIKGVAKGGVLELTAEAQQARVRMNDEEMIVSLIPTFHLTLDGDTLKGTYQLVPADGHEGMPANAFVATREKKER